MVGWVFIGVWDFQHLHARIYFGAILVLIFAYTLNILPAARLASPRHYILPVLSLSLTPFAYTFLLIRTTVQEVRGALFVTIKRCFGIPMPK